MLNEGIQVHEVAFCLFCKAKGMILYEKMRDRLFGASGEWDLFRCSQCGLVWLNPRPIFEHIEKTYLDYYTHVSDNANSSKPRLAFLRNKVKHALLATVFGYDNLISDKSSQWFGKILGFIQPLRELAGLSVMNFPANKKGILLDVGCGNGGFLAWMRNLGWKVIGVEPDPEASKVALKKFGIDVYRCTLEEAGFPEKSFDAITLRHVVEHLPNPIATLAECRRVLKDNGQITVLTPNIESLGHSMFGRSWLLLDPPRHFYLFSPLTLRLCAQQAGLTILQLRTITRGAGGIWVTSRLIRRKGWLSGGWPTKINWRLRLGELTFRALEHMLCTVKEKGEEIFMAAIKNLAHDGIERLSRRE